MNQAFVYDAVRTPFGKFGSGLAGVRPDDLAAHVIGEIVKRAPGLDVERIDEVVFGNANGAGEENRNVARMGTLLAGLPVSIPGTTVNRLCGSSLDAAIIASRQINTGDAELMLIGGAESMSRAPWVLPKTEKPYPAGDLTLASTTLGWRLVNQAMPAEWTISLGEATERLADKYGITRQAQDEFSAASHNLAAEAWDEGFYDTLVAPVPGTGLVRDEGIRPGSSAEKLAGLKTVFRDRERHRHRRERLPALGRRLRGVARIRGRRRDPGPGPAGPHRRPRRARQRPAVLRLRPGRGCEQGPREGRHRLGPGRRRRTERGVRRAVPGVHQRLGHRPVHREPARRRDRDGPPAGRLRRADPGHPGPVPAGHRGALGRRRDLHRRRPGPGRRPRKRHHRPWA